MTVPTLSNTVIILRSVRAPCLQPVHRLQPGHAEAYFACSVDAPEDGFFRVKTL